jgi:hypothetical protein
MQYRDWKMSRVKWSKFSKINPRTPPNRAARGLKKLEEIWSFDVEVEDCRAALPPPLTRNINYGLLLKLKRKVPYYQKLIWIKQIQEFLL